MSSSFLVPRQASARSEEEEMTFEVISLESTAAGALATGKNLNSINHNSLQYIMSFLRFEDILELRHVSKILDSQVKVYFSDIRIPRGFCGFNLPDELAVVESLSKRKASNVNFTGIFSEVNVEALLRYGRSISGSAELFSRVVSSCNIILPGLFEESKHEEGHVYLLNSDVLESAKNKRDGLAILAVDDQRFELLSAEIQRISMPVVTP